MEKDDTLVGSVDTLAENTDDGCKMAMMVGLFHHCRQHHVEVFVDTSAAAAVI